MNSFNSNRIALQAQSYAVSKADLVRAVKYDELVAQNRTVIDNSDFQDEVIIDNETVLPGNNNVKQKVCTINVYKSNETVPRSSLVVTRLSVSSDSGIAKGTITSWYGQLKDIPSGWQICDGTNGTPDLRDRFIVGAGSTYALGNTGGENKVILDGTQIGSHYHAFGYHNSNNTGRFLSTGGTTKNYDIVSGGTAAYWNGSGGGGNSGQSTNSLNLITSLAVATAAQQAHENRPPYYALYYIMKIE